MFSGFLAVNIHFYYFIFPSVRILSLITFREHTRDSFFASFLLNDIHSFVPI